MHPAHIANLLMAQTFRSIRQEIHKIPTPTEHKVASLYFMINAFNHFMTITERRCVSGTPCVGYMDFNSFSAAFTNFCIGSVVGITSYFFTIQRRQRLLGTLQTIERRYYTHMQSFYNEGISREEFMDESHEIDKELKKLVLDIFQDVIPRS